MIIEYLYVYPSHHHCFLKNYVGLCTKVIFLLHIDRHVFTSEFLFFKVILLQTIADILNVDTSMLKVAESIEYRNVLRAGAGQVLSDGGPNTQDSTIDVTWAVSCNQVGDELSRFSEL